jgi:hypothetical protein
MPQARKPHSGQGTYMANSPYPNASETMGGIVRMLERDLRPCSGEWQRSACHARDGTDDSEIIPKQSAGDK